MIESEILVIGGGVAGLSTAYHLAKSGKKNILVVEQEKKLGGHASGRNAGMIRQAVEDPLLARLAREGRQCLSRLDAKQWRGVDFRPIGSLLLAKGKSVGELQKIASSLRGAGLDYEWFSHRQALKRVPVLSGGDFSRALFCPSDAVVEINALLGRFLDELKKKGVPVFRGHPIRSIQKTSKGFIVKAGARKILTQKIVNAAGAWASLVAIRAQASHVPLLAYQRHLFESRRFPFAKKDWPFVWDLSHEFYFRPVREGFLMFSPCDKTLRRVQASGAVQGEKIDPRMESLVLKKMRKFSRNFKLLQIASVKSGLRTMTPDGRFVIGEDPKQKDFYWVAGLGGHGVTTCFAVGRLASDIILGKKVDPKIAKALSPRRF